ncbi:hypothetical protein NDU88_006116 [Pleurodeles waltl]|uniref:Uncharacterized protein n=1 Tax=Pleurodeles waltl TaxID=8319 RepID=A0AAV7NYG1_PLEWA|nr:hypothetical protein NDU88_006116 [Pleurodeles waltl]
MFTGAGARGRPVPHSDADCSLATDAGCRSLCVMNCTAIARVHSEPGPPEHGAKTRSTGRAESNCYTMRKAECEAMATARHHRSIRSMTDFRSVQQGKERALGGTRTGQRKRKGKTVKVERGNWGASHAHMLASQGKRGHL